MSQLSYTAIWIRKMLLCSLLTLLLSKSHHILQNNTLSYKGTCSTPSGLLKKSSTLHRALLSWLGTGWRGTPWPLEQTAGGMPLSREGWLIGVGEVGGTAHRTGCCWRRLCSHQRALPTQLKLPGYKVYQRPSCSSWSQLSNKIFICKAFENKPCVLVAEKNFKFWAEVQEYRPSTSHNSSAQRMSNCLTWS